MGGITSGTGLASGINTQQLIAQLLQIEARPRQMAERRLSQLQVQQSAFLDINSRLSSLRTSAAAFRSENIFRSMEANSSDDGVLRATASTNAQPGNYQFLVDRMVSTRQLLSRGFTSRDESAIGIDQLTIGSTEGRLDRDTALTSLNGGEGVRRGKMVITQGNSSATIDMSRIATVNEALDAINGATSVSVNARIEGGRIVLSSDDGDFTVADAVGSHTATDLGVTGSSSGGTLNGSDVYFMSEETALSSLNDGNGVFIDNDVGQTRWDFRISVTEGGETKNLNVNIGAIFNSDGEEVEGAVTTLGGVIDRINKRLDQEGITSVTAQVDSSNGRLVLNNPDGVGLEVTENGSRNTARDLGLLTDGAVNTSVQGKRIFAGMNDTLASNLRGGNGVSGSVDFTTRNGGTFSIDVSGFETVSEIIEGINTHADNDGSIVVEKNDAGTGLLVRDTTGGSGILRIEGAGAEALRIATGDDGIESNRFRGESLQRAYVQDATLLANLNGGRGIGTGRVRFTDGIGNTAELNIRSDVKTVRHLMRELNSQLDARSVNVRVQINEAGNGLIVTEKDGVTPGGEPIRIEDVNGSVARNLRIAGTADGVEDKNFINGAYDRTLEFEPGATLNDVMREINDSRTGITATIINDGSGSRPYRLSLASNATGSEGRFTFDAHGFDMGTDVLDEGRDARVFFGSSDPSRAVLLTSSSNTLDGVVSGVSIDLRSASDQPVTLNVQRDNGRIEKAVETFIEDFNKVLERIDHQTRYNKDTEERGPLLGDSTAQTLRANMLREIQSEAKGITGTFTRLSQVGVEISEGSKLRLNSERFRDALERDPEAVRELFAARSLEPREEWEEISPGVRVRNTSQSDTFTQLGVVGMIEEMTRRYVDSIDGVLTRRNQSLDTLINQQRSRIETFNERLMRRREVLERQFVGMERAISSLQVQQSAIAGLAGLTR